MKEKIEGICRIFLKGHFHRRRGAHAVVYTFILILAIQRALYVFTSNCETTVISQLSIDPITDSQLKSIKGVNYSRKV